MATFQIFNKGNLAIQSEKWNLSVAEAKHAIAQLGTPKIGSYWYANLTQPMRRAVRAKTSVNLYTGGFSTGELANAIRCESDYTVECVE